MTTSSPAPRTSSRRLTTLAAVTVAGVLALAACAPDTGSTSPTSGGGEVPVSVIYSQSGPLAAYGEAYRNGLEAGLDYATDGTGEVDGTKIDARLLRRRR